MTYEEMRAEFKRSDDEFARYLFDLLMIQEAKLAMHAPKAANQANYKRRENRG